jgi:hypothetical protein
MAKKTKHQHKNRVSLWTISFVIAAIVILMLTVAKVADIKQQYDARSKAQVNQVKLFIAPATGVAPPNQTMELYIDARNEKIPFIRAEITFDQSKMQLTDEIGTTQKLRQIIRKSTKSEANNSGRIVLILGLAVADRDNPPQGTFEVARFTFAPISYATNLATAVSIDTSTVQVVNWDGSEMENKYQNAKVILNRVTPTPTDYVSPTPKPTTRPTSGPKGQYIPPPYVSPEPTTTPYQQITIPTQPYPPITIDGDVNNDMCTNLADVTKCMGALFSFGKTKCDANLDGKTNLSDVIFIIANLGNGCGK